MAANLKPQTSNLKQKKEELFPINSPVKTKKPTYRKKTFDDGQWSMVYRPSSISYVINTVYAIEGGPSLLAVFFQYPYATSIIPKCGVSVSRWPGDSVNVV